MKLYSPILGSCHICLVCRQKWIVATGWRFSVANLRCFYFFLFLCSVVSFLHSSQIGLRVSFHELCQKSCLSDSILFLFRIWGRYSQSSTSLVRTSPFNLSYPTLRLNFNFAICERRSTLHCIHSIRIISLHREEHIFGFFCWIEFL